MGGVCIHDHDTLLGGRPERAGVTDEDISMETLTARMKNPAMIEIWDQAARHYTSGGSRRSSS